MQKKLIILKQLFLLICFLILPLHAQAMTLHLSDADVRYVLTTLAAEVNMNIVIDESVKGIVSVNLDNLSPLEAIESISKIKNLSIEIDNNVYYISERQNMHSNYGNLHVFRIQHSDLDTLANAVRISFHIPIITEKSTTNSGNEIILIDKNNNSLLFYGTDSEAKEIAAFLKQVDIPSKQVMLEAKVIAIEKNASEKLGIEWDWSKLPQYPDYETTHETIRRPIKNSNGSTSTVSETVPTIKINRDSTGFKSVPGIIQFGKGPEGIPFEFYYQATLNALITDGKANILAKPNIMALNNHEAVIRIGGSVPVPKISVTDSTTTTAYEYHDTGIILRYTPTINDNGDIIATVHTEVSSPSYVADLKAYSFTTRSADTVVRLKDGETLVIGGLIGSEEAKSISKVPFFGDLPIIGNFFRSIKKSKSDSEIIIFLTGHIKDST